VKYLIELADFWNLFTKYVPLINCLVEKIIFHNAPRSLPVSIYRTLFFIYGNALPRENRIDVAPGFEGLFT
jgi:hypothetical protein